jgi:hypothetical protein
LLCGSCIIRRHWIPRKQKSSVESEVAFSLANPMSCCPSACSSCLTPMRSQLKCAHSSATLTMQRAVCWAINNSARIMQALCYSASHRPSRAAVAIHHCTHAYIMCVRVRFQHPYASVNVSTRTRLVGGSHSVVSWSDGSKCRLGSLGDELRGGHARYGDRKGRISPHCLASSPLVSRISAAFACSVSIRARVAFTLCHHTLAPDFRSC